MTQTKYKKLSEENNQEYVSRVVNAEDKPMRADDVLALSHKRYCKLTRNQVSSCLTDSVVAGRLTKWRDIHLSRIVYAPLTHTPPQDAKPASDYMKRPSTITEASWAKPVAPIVDDELLSSRSYPNFLTTLANYYQVDVKQVQKAISDVVNDLTMNHNDEKTNTLITSIKEICAEAFQ